MIHSRSLTHRLLVAGLTLAAAAVSCAGTVYSQPYADTADGGFFASTLAGYSQFDNFTLSSDATVQSVDWSGFDLNELLTGATTINPIQFTISIYGDDGAGHPGALLSTSTIDNSGNAVMTDQMFMGMLHLYNYSGTLITPFDAKAGTTYWLGINDPTDNADWFWGTGSGGDDTHIANIAGKVSSFGDDFAFTLKNAQAVPEPGSLLAVGLGLAAFARRARRR